MMLHPEPVLKWRSESGKGYSRICRYLDLQAGEWLGVYAKILYTISVSIEDVV